ncbi:hypothetical protein ACTXJX_10220 [Glutamicibacter ardleyensis]|uniref:hypothetical protein n=1 Tax=Glutamicibacter ardleyensis TaxID=225894 RepID=UPI003FD4AB3C
MIDPYDRNAVILLLRQAAAHVANGITNDIVDAADKLPEPAAPKAPVPCYTTHSTPLTAADGTPEPDLPANIAD